MILGICETVGNAVVNGECTNLANEIMGDISDAVNDLLENQKTQDEDDIPPLEDCSEDVVYVRKKEQEKRDQENRKSTMENINEIIARGNAIVREEKEARMEQTITEQVVEERKSYSKCSQCGDKHLVLSITGNKVCHTISCANNILADYNRINKINYPNTINAALTNVFKDYKIINNLYLFLAEVLQAMIDQAIECQREVKTKRVSPIVMFPASTKCHAGLALKLEKILGVQKQKLIKALISTINRYALRQASSVPSKEKEHSTQDNDMQNKNTKENLRKMEILFKDIKSKIVKEGEKLINDMFTPTKMSEEESNEESETDDKNRCSFGLDSTQPSISTLLDSFMFIDLDKKPDTSSSELNLFEELMNNRNCICGKCNKENASEEVTEEKEDSGKDNSKEIPKKRKKPIFGMRANVPAQKAMLLDADKWFYHTAKIIKNEAAIGSTEKCGCSYCVETKNAVPMEKPGVTWSYTFVSDENVKEGDMMESNEEKKALANEELKKAGDFTEVAMKFLKDNFIEIMDFKGIRLFEIRKAEKKFNLIIFGDDGSKIEKIMGSYTMMNIMKKLYKGTTIIKIYFESSLFQERKGYQLGHDHIIDYIETMLALL